MKSTSFLTWLFGPIEYKCKHKWQTIGINYLKRGGKFNNLSEQTFRELVNGTTKVSYKCIHCDILKTEQLVGKVELPGWKYNND